MRLGISVAVTQPQAGGPGVDPSAQAWAAAVTLAGGTYQPATLTALSAFITSAKAHGYWTKLYCFNPMAGDDLDAALVQWVNGTWAQATNVGFVGGDYSEANGMVSPTAGVYLLTGVYADTFTPKNTHQAVYNRASVVSTRNFGIALGSASGEIALFMPFRGDGKGYSDDPDMSSGSRVVSTSALATPYGFGMAAWNGNTHTIYQAGVDVGAITEPAAVGTFSHSEIAVFGNNAGSNGTDNPIASYSFGLGMTAQNAADYAADMQAFQTALGRQV